MAPSQLLLTSVLGLCVIAAPLQARDEPSPISAKPSPKGKPIPPSELFLYNTASGSIAPAPVGVVSKFPADGGQDTTTLATFVYPPQSAGKKCRLGVYLDATATVGGSGKLDVFSSLAPAPGGTSGWPPGNQRNTHIGRLSTGVGSFATWDAVYSRYLTEETDCAVPGTVEAYELVGVYDEDFVSWDPRKGGLEIYYS